jgi:drug/metabolite transporter (DMT)-like permease
MKFTDNTPYYLIGIASSMAASGGQVFLKLSARKFTLSRLINLEDRNLLVGILLLVMSMLLSVYALRRIEFSAYYSLTALNYLFISSFSKIILKEKMDDHKIFANIIIVIGILVFNL